MKGKERKRTAIILTESNMDNPNQTYRVLRLCAQDFMRLKAVDVTPGRHAVVVAGKNAAGKTCLLKAIAAVLGGKKQVEDVPIRKGADSSTILCVLGEEREELLVKRTFDANGKSLLEVTSAEGYKAPSPQAILDGLYASAAFEPLAFVRMKPAEQLETLRRLVGLDFTGLDEQRKALYDRRTALNKETADLASQAKAITLPDDIPEKPASIMELMFEQQRRQEHNAANEKERAKLAQLEHGVAAHLQRVASQVSLVRDLEEKLQRAKSVLEDAKESCSREKVALDAHKATLAVLRDQDVAGVQQQIIAAESTNAAVADRAKKVKLYAQAENSRAQANLLTDQIGTIDADKAKQVSEANWPIPNLSLGEGGVLYNGLPFSQASGAEQLAVSFSMVSALHPDVRIALIRDASLLDADQFAAVCQMAEKYDMQVWLERVSDDAGPCGILIEDGTVVAGATPSEAATPIQPKKKRKPSAKSRAITEAAADDEAERNDTGVSLSEQSKLPFME